MAQELVVPRPKGFAFTRPLPVMFSRPCRRLMAVAALCLLLLASSPGSPFLEDPRQLIGGVIALAGLGSLMLLAHDTPEMTSEAREEIKAAVVKAVREEFTWLEEKIEGKLDAKIQEKLRKAVYVSMASSMVVGGLKIDNWRKDRENKSEIHKMEKEFQSEIHQNEKEHQRKMHEDQRNMQEQADAYQKDMQARDMAHESKLFLSKMIDQWVSIVCKVCGIFTLAYLLRYLLVPGPAWAIEMPVPGHAWAIANP